LESANVVGYHNSTAAGESASLGPVFKQIGSTGASYLLSDFTVSNMSPGEDCIQFLDPDTASTYLCATYIDPALFGEELGGWWDNDDIGGTSLNDEQFAAGTAFLCLFTSGSEVSFNYAGEVEKGVKQITIDTESPFICNPLPADLTLGQIVVENMSPGEDCFQFLDVNTADAYLTATYVDPDMFGDELAGWWDNDAIGETSLNDQPLAAGEGVLGLMTSGNEMTVVFPALIAE
jgi:hypothetical protein